MATTNVGKPFGVVTSKNQATAITESKQADNAGQFYITRTNNSNTGGVGNTEGNASEAISLTINGNVLRGISKDDATKLANLSTNTGGGATKLEVFSWLGLSESASLEGVISTNTGIDNDTALRIGGPEGIDFIPRAFDLKLGSGLTSRNGRIDIELGNGLETRENKLRLNVNKPLDFSEGSLKINLGSGVTINELNELSVRVGEELNISQGEVITLNADYLSGTEKDVNKFYYSKGGIVFANTIKSGQKNDSVTESGTFTNPTNYMRLRCGTGLAFQEGYQDFGDNSSQILGHDGKYYVNIDNTTIGLNTSSKLRVKHDDTLSESSNGLSVKVGNNLVTGDDGINIQLPVPTPSDLQQLPVSTAAILVNDDNNGLCVDIPALKRLVELIMAAK